MECRKSELVKDVPGLYAVTDVTLDGKEYYAAASENRGGRVYLVDPVTQKATELFGGQGGVMAILDVKGENAVLFIEEFYPVFDSATAKVIKADLEKKKDIVDLKDKERVLPTKDEHKRMTIPGLIGSVIGVLVGIVPGTGGDISALISWDICKRVSRHPKEFGDGSVEGLATTCASNNASIGGALTTALALGIPGDGNTAVLLGALTMYGMVTGPTLLSNSAPFVCRLYIIMIIANLIILPLGLLSAKACIRLLSIKSQYIQMAVLLICCVGAYSMNRNYTDVIVMFIAGICGFFFRKYDYPLGPMILGLLLGDMCETNLRRTLMLSNGSYLQLFTGPISIGLIVLILLAIGWPFISNLFQKKKNKKVEG